MLFVYENIFTTKKGNYSSKTGIITTCFCTLARITHSNAIAYRSIGISLKCFLDKHLELHFIGIARKTSLIPRPV